MRLRTYCATYRNGYTVFVTYDEAMNLFNHKRKPVSVRRYDVTPVLIGQYGRR